VRAAWFALLVSGCAAVPIAGGVDPAIRGDIVLNRGGTATAWRPDQCRSGAHDARRIGLVHEVVPLADLETTGAKVVEQLLANAPEALAETKALAMENSVGGMAVDDEAYARLVRMHAAKRQTREASEGLASFAEKRAADWVGGKT